MADSDHVEQPACFVAMPVTTPGNYAEKLGDTSHFPHVLEHLFTPALIKAGYRVIAPTSRGSQLIHAEIIKNLEQADLVLCDLSSLNANVFFELGIRTSLDRPVALVKDKVTERIPFDLNAINTHTYDESLTPWTLASEIEHLTEHIKAVETSADKGNDMWHYFGLTKRATPAEITGNPTEAKLDLLLTEMSALKNQWPVNSLPGIRDRTRVSLESIDEIVREILDYRYGFALDKTSTGYQVAVRPAPSIEDIAILERELEFRTGEKFAVVPLDRPSEP